MRLQAQALGRGAPLLCLHGFLGSGDNLWPLADHLKERFRSWLLDLRGHGRSPHGGPYSLEALADDVAESMAAEGVSRASVVGHSLGGKVAMALALRHPERVQALLIADISAEAARPHYAHLLDAMAAVPLAGLGRREEAEPYLRQAEPTLETRRFLLKNLVADAAGGFRWRFDLQGLRRDHAQLLAAVPAGAPWPGPSLLIRGRDSSFVSPAGLARTRELFPALQVLELPGGHWIHVDAKPAFNAAAEAFLGPAA